MKLNKYIRNQLLFLTVNFTLIPTFILWIVQSRDIVDLVVNNGISAWLFIKLSVLTLPAVLPHMLPFIVLLSSIFLIYRLYTDNEITIFWAAGNNISFMAKPYLYIASIIAVIILILNAWLAPQSSQKLKEEIFYVKNDLAKALLKKADFLYPIDNIRIYLHDIKAGSEITGFFLEDNSLDHSKRIFTAEKAVIVTEGETNKLLLINGRINVIPLQSSEKASILDFEKFTLDIQALSHKEDDNIYLKARDYTIDKLLFPSDTLDTKTRNRFISEGHQRITAAFSPLAYICFFIIAFIYPMVPRRFPINRIFMVICAVILLKIIVTYFENLSVTNIKYIGSIYLTYFVILISTFIYITRHSKEKKYVA